jgi:hypothetical protein
VDRIKRADDGAALTREIHVEMPVRWVVFRGYAEKSAPPARGPPRSRWTRGLHTATVELSMKPYAIAQRPWTCRFGRTGVTIEEIDAVRSRVDDVFWACHRTGRIPALKITTRAECAECPFWEPAPNLRGERLVS